MLIDSHCHLNRIDLTAFDNNLDNLLRLAAENGVEKLLSVCVELDEFPYLKKIADQYNNIYISVGVHPCDEPTAEFNTQKLIDLANSHKSCIAIGETGLDYYHSVDKKSAQQDKFRQHIQAAIATDKPLIIHTRHANPDTINILKEENASQVGGVMHCFAEDLEIANQAIELGFYISFSGIVTFKNAKNIQNTAKNIPLERMLIETDAPYLAPMPHRGKPNHPALLKHTAIYLTELLDISFADLANITSNNFNKCFKVQ